MQSVVVHISHKEGLKNKVAHWLSRLEEHFLQQKDLSSKDIKEDNISCLLFMNLEFCEEDIPLKLMEGTTFQEVLQVADAGAGQEIEKDWTPAETFADVHGYRHDT